MFVCKVERGFVTDSRQTEFFCHVSHGRNADVGSVAENAINPKLFRNSKCTFFVCYVHDGVGVRQRVSGPLLIHVTYKHAITKGLCKPDRWYLPLPAT